MTQKRIGNILPSRKGKRHTEETRIKMSLTRKGQKKSEETKRKMSLAKRGDRAYQWKGGISKNKQYRSWSKNKRNRLKDATIKSLGGHTFGEWENLKAQYNWTCPCCGKSEPEIKLTEDHIIPLSKGGSDLIENIQPLCKNCNCKKHTKIIKFIC